MEAGAPELALVKQPENSAEDVGFYYVWNYYQALHFFPEVAYKFYLDISKLERPEADGSMSITTTLQGIHDKILSLNYGDFRFNLKSVDSVESFGGLLVFVTGCLTGKDNLGRNFCQTFFLAPQEQGYFILNDMFQYVGSANQCNAPQVPATYAVAPVTPEISGQATHGYAIYIRNLPVGATMSLLADNFKKFGPIKYGGIEVIDKGAYAQPGCSIGFVEFESASSVQEAVEASPILIGGQKVYIEERRRRNTGATHGYGYAICIRNLPDRATMALLADRFKEFGPIKNGGIEVVNRGVYAQPGRGIGFVEFESESSVQEAVEASPILIGGQKVFIEKKRSRSTGGNNRDYARVELNTRADYRGGSSNRGGYGYQRVDNRGSNDGYQQVDNRGRNDGYPRVDDRGRNDGYPRVDNRGSNINDGYQRVDDRGSNVGRMKLLVREPINCFLDIGINFL